MDIDNLFVNALLRAGSEEVRDILRRVPPEMVQGMERTTYKFLRSFFKNSKGSLPSKQAVRAKFPDFVLQRPKDTLHFYIDELRERSRYEALTDALTEAQNHLFQKDVASAEESIHSLRAKLGTLDIIEADTIRTGFRTRVEAYKIAKKNKGVIGFQTRIPSIDKRIAGLQDEVFVIMGKQGVGKTYTALLLACNLWPQIGAPLVIVSNELSKRKVATRIDSIMGKFSASRYRRGQLTKVEERRLVELPKLYKNLPELHIIPGRGKSVDEIEDEMIAIEPALFVVDGVYLTDMGFNDRYKNTMEASAAYQGITKKMNIPGIFTTQMIGDETKYARAVQEDADIVLKMFQSDAMHIDKLMGFQFMKIREEDAELKFHMRWDFDTWTFEEVDIDVPDEGAEHEFEGET